MSAGTLPLFSGRVGTTTEGVVAITIVSSLPAIDSVCAGFLLWLSSLFEVLLIVFSVLLFVVSFVVVGTTVSVCVATDELLLVVVLSVEAISVSVVVLILSVNVATCWVCVFFLNRLSFVGNTKKRSPTMIRQIIVQIRQIRA